MQEDNVLRFALMDKEGSGRGLAEAKATIAQIRALKNAVIAVGQNIELNEFDRWLKEISGISANEHVRWVHTKFMLVDPLSDDPVVITGSANFSGASVNTNHENMLVIRGDTRVADIYLGEFMRQFSSYAFRDAAASRADRRTSGRRTCSPIIRGSSATRSPAHPARCAGCISPASNSGQARQGIPS